jgi:hypothetical protein
MSKPHTQHPLDNCGHTPHLCCWTFRSQVQGRKRCHSTRQENGFLIYERVSEGGGGETGPGASATRTV